MNGQNTRRAGSLLMAWALATAVLAGQATGGRPAAPQTEAAQIQQVRVALGHGQLAEARRLAGAIPGAAGRDLGTALVDVFEGKDDDARPKLEPLARVNIVGDAALELGLLEIRHGQRDQGWKRLDPIAAVRTFAGPDDYFRLARAARAIHEYKLAADAYTETAEVPRADIQAARGDLFLQRHRPGDAASDYRKALQLDPTWIPAMVGLARALVEESPEQADALMANAQKQAPNHPDFLLFAAEQQIQREDKKGASDLLDKLATARPGTPDEFALRAAIAFAGKDTPAMDAALASLTKADPRSALGLRRIGEQSARDYRFEDAAGLAERATVLDPDDPFAFFDLGLYLMRTGDEPAARKALERSWALDESNRATKNMLDVLDKIDTMETVAAGDLILKFASNEAAVLKTYAVPLAEEAMETFGGRYKFKPQGPILVEVFPLHDSFAVRTLAFPGITGALGACFGRVIAMDSPSARPPGDFSWQATLWHELAHVYTLQMSKYRVPRWLTEGISVFEEHRRQPAWGRELTLEFAATFGRGKNFGVKKLPDAFKNPESLALAYFEASLLVEHLVELNGDAGLRSLLLAYADGAKDPDAFAKAFGKSVDDVDVSFKKFLTDHYGVLSQALADPPSKVDPDNLPALRQRAEQAPDNFVSQLSLGLALAKAGQRDDARARLERAAQLAPQASGPDSPHAVMAVLAEQAGDITRARRELRQLLTYNHENVVAARKLVSLSSEPAAAADLDYGLRLVADLDPFDAAVHVQLGRRLFAQNSFAPALIEFRAALALGPPNLAEAYADVGETYFKLGRKEEAKRQIILSLEQAPTYARAQDILLAILGRN
jgi:tetratricopeptide (TPR) repeat protein